MANILVLESAEAPFFTSKFHRMKELGHTIYVVREGIQINEDIDMLVDKIIPVRVHNFENVENSVSEIINMTKDLNVEGVLTRWDACIPVLSKLSEKLGIETIPYRVANILRCKSTMREAFKEWNLPSAKFGTATTLEQAQDIATHVGFPLILKPTLGYGSWGVVKVNTIEELEVEFDKIRRLSIENFNSKEILVEEYLDGIELIIDSIIHDGEIIYTNVIEKPKPMTGTNGFAEIEFITPPIFTNDELKAIEKINKDLNLRLGMKNAISHVEMRLTSDGPKLLEINPRLPGAKNIDIAKIVTGVDLELASIELSYGKRPETHKIQNGYAGFRIITPNKPGELVSVKGIESSKNIPGVVEVSIMKPLGQRVLQLPYEIQDFLGFIVVKGDSRGQVLDTLDKVEKNLEIEIV
ncbi:ATP-grasp domain-containing protein [Paenibacillus polymyxa]|uniref:ATP-grasp domain-containing protein n=1 Tax=Paenibacillus polymyxa TaxID=1406 RepID=UPI00307EFF6F